MSNKISPITKQLIIIQAKRVIEILEDPTINLEEGSYYDNCKATSELKAKMKELRRDTIKLQKELKYE